MSTLLRNAPWSAALSLSLAVAAIGCGDDDNSDKPGPDTVLDGSVGDASIDSSAPSTPDATVQTDGGTLPPSPVQPNIPGVYMYSIAVYSPDGTANQYVLLRDKIDFNITTDDIKSARVIGGYAGLTAINGSVIVGESETPFATKYKIESDLKWTQVGEPLNFSNYVSDDADGLNFYFQAIKGADMYFFHGTERTSRLHWNVDQWKILNDYTDTKLPVPPAGSVLGSAGNRTGMRDWKGPVLQAFQVSDETTYKGADDSYITVYDPATHAERAVITVPCPGLQQQTMDEQGNVYVSTTFAEQLLSELYGRAKTSCIVKIKPDGTLDETFTTDLKKYTGGFRGVNFRYLHKGKALANVLRADKLGAGPFTGEIDPAIEERVTGRFVDDKLLQADFGVWETRVVDLASGTSKVVTGWADEKFTPHYMITWVLDDRAFITVQYDPYGTATNAAYELDVETATVKLIGKTIGELSTAERIR